MAQGKKRIAPRLQGEVRQLRRQLDETLAELDLRRRELTNWRLQVRRHWRALAACGAVAAGTVAWLVYRHRERERPLGKVRRLRRALARMIDNPDAVARSSPGSEAAAAVVKPVAGGLIRRLLGR